MRFFQRLSEMQELSRFVLTRCMLLCCALLCSALVILVWAGGYTYQNVLLYSYAGELQTEALIVLGTGLIGCALLEDVLTHRT